MPDLLESTKPDKNHTIKPLNGKLQGITDKLKPKKERSLGAYFVEVNLRSLNIRDTNAILSNIHINWTFLFFDMEVFHEPGPTVALADYL